MENLIKDYFKFFSNKDIPSLEKLFAKDIKLVDWEMSVEGKDEVIKANKKIFDTLESIKIELKELYLQEMTAICLVEILINNKEKLKVIDMIKFNNDKEIFLISAFKQ